MKYLLHGGFWLIFAIISFNEVAFDYFVPLFFTSLGFAFITMGLQDLYNKVTKDF